LIWSNCNLLFYRRIIRFSFIRGTYLVKFLTSFLANKCMRVCMHRYQEFLLNIALTSSQGTLSFGEFCFMNKLDNTSTPEYVH